MSSVAAVQCSTYEFADTLPVVNIPLFPGIGGVVSDILPGGLPPAAESFAPLHAVNAEIVRRTKTIERTVFISEVLLLVCLFRHMVLYHSDH